MSENNFSRGYVLRLTAKHCRKDIDFSIRKTFERLKEFEENSKESQEVFETLGLLHGFRKILDDFQKLNSEKFR